MAHSYYSFPTDVWSYCILLLHLLDKVYGIPEKTLDKSEKTRYFDGTKKKYKVKSCLENKFRLLTFLSLQPELQYLLEVFEPGLSFTPVAAEIF
jgi:hypothetical protein